MTVTLEFSAGPELTVTVNLAAAATAVVPGETESSLTVLSQREPGELACENLQLDSEPRRADRMGQPGT